MGEIVHFESMTKKVIQKFWRMKIGNFFGEKVKLGVWKFFGNRGKSETGGKCIIASGRDGRPRLYRGLDSLTKRPLEALSNLRLVLSGLLELP